jgi:hypothetical protein
MGLMYVFPVSAEETDFVEVKNKTLTLKSYGLPYIFWGYAFAILAVLLFMFLAIKDPLLKLAQLGDETDAFLVYSLFAFLASLPLFIFAFFFYEKRIIRNENELSMEYRVFAIRFFKETFTLRAENPFEVTPYLTSPNVARIKGGDEMTGFQNKGYFILWLTTHDGKKIIVDRHSRKADLSKLEILLQNLS